MTVSVIIPTISETEPKTVQSIPDECEIVVVREGNRAEARNMGAVRADGEVLVFCDDDIAFSPEWFESQLSALERNEVRGLADFGLGLILTRLMAIHTADFVAVGGFDPALDHMEDTDFSMRAKRHGLEVTKIPRDAVKHDPHENDITTMKRLKSLVTMAENHTTDLYPILWKIP